LNDGYWHGLEYDGFPVTSKSAVDYNTATLLPRQYDDYDESLAFIRAPLGTVRSADMAGRVKELKFLMSHCDRRLNELIFLKCEESDCHHCKDRPVVAVEAMELIRKSGGAMFTPRVDPLRDTHFTTFLDMLQVPAAELTTADLH
jgi:hypothetical protein